MIHSFAEPVPFSLVSINGSKRHSHKKRPTKSKTCAHKTRQSSSTLETMSTTAYATTSKETENDAKPEEKTQIS